MNMKRTLWILGMAAPFLIALAMLAESRRSLGASPADNSTSGVEVKIDNFSFGPAALTVPVGATVTWINQDDVPHTVVSSDGKGIKSSVLDTDQKFTYTFAKAGTYEYYCSIHPKMTGKVIVQ